MTDYYCCQVRGLGKFFVQNQIGEMLVIVSSQEGCLWVFPKIVGFPPNHPKSNGVIPLLSPSILGVPLVLETPIYVKLVTPLKTNMFPWKLMLGRM